MVLRQLAFSIFYDPYVFSHVDFLCYYVSDQPIPANISTLSASLSSSISQPVQKTISVSIANVYDQTDPATKAYNLSKLSDFQTQTIHTPLFIVSEVTGDKKQQISTSAYHWAAEDIRPFPKAGERARKRKSAKRKCSWSLVLTDTPTRNELVVSLLEYISYPSCISSNNTIIHDPNKISEKFHLFFISIPDELQKNIDSSHTNFYNYLKTPNLESIFIKPTDENEILYIVLYLNDGKASGPYSIPTFILKFLAWDISPLLSKLFNLSFVTGIFPNIFKTAFVKPIHKKGSKLDCNNYRPISLLSNISKILAKLMYSRIYHFLNNFKCLYGRQPGFCLKHSTSHALISITEMIRGAINSGSFACGVFIDFQKALDTVDHKILIKKLFYYGIQGIVNN
nr:uncharacterized protein LOC124818176 [Hydra vulgaris]